MSNLISKSGKKIGEVTSPQDGDLLKYNSATGRLENLQPAAEPQPKTMLANIGHGYGRVHVYGNQVFIAGNNGVERVYGWGENNSLYYSKPRPFDIQPKEIVWMAQNFAQIHVVDAEGYLYSCGDDDLGSLGTGSYLSGSASTREFKRNIDPNLYGPGKSVIAVWNERLSESTSTDSTGAVHVQVNDNGVYKIWAFGYNGNGQLGIGGTANTGTPTQGSLVVLDGKKVVAYDSHSYVTMMAMDDGSLWGAGYNNHGQLGIDFIGNSAISQAKDHTGAFMSDVIDVKIVYSSGIGVCSFALKSDGTVWSCGDNIDGGLGWGSAGNTQYFRQVMLNATTPLTGITKIEDAGSHLDQWSHFEP